MMLIEAKTTTKAKLHRKLHPLLVIAVGALCIAICTFPLYFLRFPEFQMEHSFQIYPAAEKRFEVRAYDYNKLGQKNLYYWTVDSITAVQQFYEQYYPPFKNGNKARDWLITVINKNESLPEDQNVTILGLDDFCTTEELYECGTISLINLAQQKPEHNIAILFPVGLQPKDDLMAQIASLPSNGTLIVYSYRIANFS